MKVCGKEIRIQGRLIRIARLDGDKYQFLDDPEPVVDGLRKCGTRIDLFTFMQKLPETSPKYRYPMEWDNLAVLPVSTVPTRSVIDLRSFLRRYSSSPALTFCGASGS